MLQDVFSCASREGCKLAVNARQQAVQDSGVREGPKLTPPCHLVSLVSLLLLLGSTRICLRLLDVLHLRGVHGSDLSSHALLVSISHVLVVVVDVVVVG